jgi:hypothetical protein
LEKHLATGEKAISGSRRDHLQHSRNLIDFDLNGEMTCGISTWKLEKSDCGIVAWKL